MRTTTIPDPAAALFRKTRRQLLAWLFTHTDESFYVRELVRVSGAAIGAVSKELEELTAAGILRRTARGNQVFYQANPASPIFEEVKSIILKTAGLADQLRRALAPLTDRIRVALIYGSGARGWLRAPSDVDLLVVGEVPFGDVVSALASAQSSLGREINPVVYSAREFRSKLGARQHFLTTVMRGPNQFLAGGPSDLERLGAKRLAAGAPHGTRRGRRPPGPRRARSGG
jgi:DNA-binding transcriptional ArsR family regulator